MDDKTCNKILKCNYDYDCIYNITCELCDCVLENKCYFFCLDCWENMTQ